MRSLAFAVFCWLVVCALCLWLIPKAVGCPIRTVYSTPYVAPYVAPVKVIVAEVFTPVFVPTFTVAYNPALVPAAPAPVGNPNPSFPAQNGGGELSVVLTELRKLSGRIDRLEQGGGGQFPHPKKLQPSKGEDPDGKTGVESGPNRNRFTVMQAKCAQCHTAGSLDKETKLVLFDAEGLPATLDARTEAKVMRKSYRGEMPPPGNSRGIKPLTDEEVALIVGSEEKPK